MDECEDLYPNKHTQKNNTYFKRMASIWPTNHRCADVRPDPLHTIALLNILPVTRHKNIPGGHTDSAVSTAMVGRTEQAHGWLPSQPVSSRARSAAFFSHSRTHSRRSEASQCREPAAAGRALAPRGAGERSAAGQLVRFHEILVAICTAVQHTQNSSANDIAPLKALGALDLVACGCLRVERGVRLLRVTSVEGETLYDQSDQIIRSEIFKSDV